MKPSTYKLIASVMFLTSITAAIVLLLQQGGTKLLLGVFLLITANEIEKKLLS